MRPVTFTMGPYAAANATNIRTATAIAAAGPVVLNGTAVTGTVATLDVMRRIAFASSGNDSGITFTITGTDAIGNPISEVLVGGNAVPVNSVLDYKTVTSVVASGASAGTVSIGTASSPLGSGPWVRLDQWASPGSVAIQVNISGTVTYTVQQTLDDPNSPTNPVLPANMTWLPSSDTNVVGATANQQSNYAYPPTFARVQFTSGTGSLTATFSQGGAIS